MKNILKKIMKHFTTGGIVLISAFHHPVLTMKVAKKTKHLTPREMAIQAGRHRFGSSGSDSSIEL